MNPTNKSVEISNAIDSLIDTADCIVLCSPFSEYSSGIDIVSVCVIGTHELYTETINKWHEDIRKLLDSDKTLQDVYIEKAVLVEEQTTVFFRINFTQI